MTLWQCEMATLMKHQPMTQIAAVMAHMCQQSKCCHARLHGWGALPQTCTTYTIRAEGGNQARQRVQNGSIWDRQA